MQKTTYNWTAITHHNCSKIMQKIWKTVYILRKIILCSQIWWTINLQTNIHNLQGRMCNWQTKMYSLNIDIRSWLFLFTLFLGNTKFYTRRLRLHRLASSSTTLFWLKTTFDEIYSNSCFRKVSPMKYQLYIIEFPSQCSGVGRVWTLIMDWVHTCPAM